MKNHANVLVGVVKEREKAETPAKEAKNSLKTSEITENKVVKAKKVGKTAKKA